MSASHNEARARVALRVGDQEAFGVWAKRCGGIFRAFNNRALIAKHERLMREGRGSEASAPLNGPVALRTAAMTHVTAALSACPGPRERARLGLDFLVARSGAVGGFLYAIEPSGPVLVAQAGTDEPPSGLSIAVVEHLRVESYDADTTGADAPTEVQNTNAPSATSTLVEAFAGYAIAERELRPCVVGHASKDGFAITGIAILVVDPKRPYAPPADAAAHLSRSWFDAGDVTSIAAWLSAAMTAG